MSGSSSIAFHQSRLVLASLLTLVVFSLLPRTAHSQTASPDYLQGTESFRYLFKKNGFAALHELNELQDPKGKVLVVLGDLSPLDRIPGGLARFVSRGGAVLAATDQPTLEGALRKQFGIIVTGEMGRTEPSRQVAYRGIPECPIAMAYDNVDTTLFKELPSGQSGGRRQGLATNLPSRLLYVSPAWQKRVQGFFGLEDLAFVTDDCHFKASGEGAFTYRPSEVGGLLAVGGPYGKGKILILADHSIFINNMMQLDDDSNMEFALRCVNWLQGDQAERSELLFMENGQAKSLDIQLKRLPTLHPFMKLDMAQAVNQLLANAEEENIFDLILQGLMPRSWSMQTFRVILLTGFLLSFSLVSLGLARYRRDGSQTLLSKALTQTASTSGILDQRQKALIKSGNWWEAARALGLRFFDEAELRGSSLPASHVTGSLWQQWRSRRRLWGLWKLAHAESPRRISPRQYRALRHVVNQMKADLARGSLSFPSVNSSGDSPPPNSQRL
ncbi:MAG: hypothetical protein ACJ8FY_23080 [Gemmataceae bacterium]